jgi:hypothetical protein
MNLMHQTAGDVPRLSLGTRNKSEDIDPSPRKEGAQDDIPKKRHNGGSWSLDVKIPTNDRGDVI